MSALLAGGAAAVAVFACWDLTRFFDRQVVIRLYRQLMRPLKEVSSRGREPTRIERARLIIVGTVAAFGAGLLLSGALLAVIVALLMPALVLVAIRLRQVQYRVLLRSGAPAFARELASALRAGFSIRRGIAEAANGLQGPIAAEIRVAATALELGETTDEVLERLRARAGCPEFDALVAAILLRRDAGGDLVGLLTDLAASMEETVRLRREAKTATSQARFTAGLILVLPIGALTITELASPGYLERLFDNPISAMMVVASLVLQLIGIFAVIRMARVPK